MGSGLNEKGQTSPNIEKCIQLVDLATLSQKETRAMIRRVFKIDASGGGALSQ